MKLTGQEKHHVYRYLKRQKFKTQEFFDESFDHLICHIESEISKKVPFLEALDKYEKSIQKVKYYSYIFIVSRGWKALEHQFINSKNVNLIETQQKFLKAQILTYRFFIWLFLATLYWYLIKADYLIIHIVLFISLILAGILIPFLDEEIRKDTFKWPKPIQNYEKWIIAWEYKTGLTQLILPYFAGKLLLNSTNVKFELISEVVKFVIIFYVLLNQVSKLEMFYQLKNRKSLKKQHI